MADPSLTNVLRYIRRLIRSAPGADCSDAQLLQEFVSRRDEAAFTALVGRHGPLVLAVCRNVLRDIHAAEDAFQATFLVLARKAASIRRPQALAPWLHRVAYHIALTARADAARRQTRERQTQTMALAAPAEPGSNDWQAILHEEVNQLPDKYRVPVVLCYFEGKTHQEAASELGWPLGTLKGRLSRARDLLRNRLARRGVALTVGMMTGIQSAQAVVGPLSAGLLDATVRAALRGAASAPVAALAKAALRTLMLTRLKLAAFVLLGLATVALGAGAVLNRARPDARFSQEQTLQDEVGPKVAQVPTDVDGDPLPVGARLRLGSARFRHGDRIVAMAYSPDGRTLVTAGKRGLIRTWSARTGQPLAAVRHPHLISNGPATFSPDSTLVATVGGPGFSTEAFEHHLRLARVSDPIVLHGLELPLGEVCAVAFSRDGNYVAAAGKGDILLWDCATRQVVRRFPVTGEQRQVKEVALSPDGRLLVALETGKAIRLWDVAAGAERSPLAVEGSGGNALAFSGDGRILACGLATGEIRLWNPDTGKTIRTLALPDNTGPLGTTEGVEQVALSSDGNVVATSGDQGTIRLWDAPSGKARVLQRGSGCPYCTLAFAPNDRTLAIGGDIDEITLWDIPTGRRISVTKEPSLGPCFAAVSPDGVTIATQHQRGKVQFWDARTGRTIGTFDAAGSWIAFSPDGTTLAAGGSLWDLGAGQVAAKLPRSGTTHEEMARVLPFATFSPDQQFLALSGLGVEVWRLATRQRLWHDGWGPKALHPAGPVETHPAVFSVDSKIIAWASDKRPVVDLRDAATGKEVGLLPCPGPCWTIAFCPDGQSLAAAGENYIQLWNLSSKRMIRQLEQAPAEPYRLGLTECRPMAFSPDGRTLAAAGVNNTICLWDVATGSELRTLSGHASRLRSLSFALDGRTLVSGSDDTTALVWDVAPAIELVHQAFGGGTDKQQKTLSTKQIGEGSP